MFPNPQDALPLPLKPNVERYRKLAKDLLRASKSENTTAIRDWSEKWVTSLVKLSGLVITLRLPVEIEGWVNEVENYARRTLSPLATTGAADGRYIPAHDSLPDNSTSNSVPGRSTNGTQPRVRPCRLTDAQFVIARSHGFASWSKFVKHLNGLTDKSSPIARFEAAADSIIAGKIKILQQLLAKDPNLIHRRSTREHQATLLHYVSANGVEGYRQKTPKNAVKIARLLLNAGAKVDAEADVYGGGATTLGLVATSVHPYVAGVQNELIQLLLDHGAQLDREHSGGNQQIAVRASLANGCFDAAVYLAEHGARLDLESAAGLGRLEVVKTYFDDQGKLKPRTTEEQFKSAFFQACCWGRNNVVQFLLEKGVDIKAHDADGQTGLHWAAIGGQLETIKLLLKYDPPLEARNVYGGTVLGQAAWSASHGGEPEKYAAIIETLTRAGAK